MAQEKKKLDSLCKLLDSIIIEHSGKEASRKDIKKCPPTQSVPKTPTKKTPAAPTPANTMAEAKEDKSREEIELERKARKEAKKARKKGGERGNTEEKGETKKENTKSNKTMKEDAKALPAGDQEKKEGNKQKSTPVKQQQQQPPAQPPATSSGSTTSGKSKADLKRERREKQEAQRQAKEEAKAQQQEETQQQQKKKAEMLTNLKNNVMEKKKKTAGEGVKSGKEKRSSDKRTGQRRIPLLGHLTPPVSHAPQHPVNSDTIHPAIRSLGIKMKDRIIDGSTARVVSTLAALKRLINDYRTPESCDLSRDLAEKLTPNVAFLNACRPQAVAMDNAIRFLKHKVNSIDPSMPEGQAKAELRTAIDQYVRENISLASSTIASHATALTQPDDVILTFGYSALVCKVVEAARESDNRVSVVVADSPHPSSGLAMVQQLAARGVTTYYRLITDITNIIDKVTKVVVEAEAVMMNGAIQGVCGTASLALAAATYHKPFIVLCHTYKFCNNDLTDSLVVNELGDADKVVWGPSGQQCGQLAKWRETQNLNVVSLVYDVTPASLVTALVTEQSVLPTSAVPVIIRRNYADVLGQD